MATLYVSLVAVRTPAVETTDQKYDFGPTARDGFVHVAADAGYDAARGYGFEPAGPAATSQPADGRSVLFSVRTGPGNFRVTVRLGDAAESATAIKAESRRVMLPLTRTPAGGTTEVTFVVHVRSPTIDANTSVKLLDREKTENARSWDDKLTLEFCGPRPAVRSVEVRKADDVVAVFLAGDSTVCDQGNEPWAAWGQLLPMYFGPTVAVANYAESGRTMRSFKAENRWAKILSLVKPGDYVLIQFGHNDMKEKGDRVGPYTSFSDSLRWAVKAVRDKGGTAVLLTPMHRRKFVGAEVQPTFGDYPDAVRKVAAEMDAPLIDLQTMTKPLYEFYGPDNSKKLFVHYPANTFPGQKDALRDDTHFNAFGADQIARCVIQGLRDAKLPLADALKPGLPAYDPTHPGDPAAFDLPASAAADAEKPAGS